MVGRPSLVLQQRQQQLQQPPVLPLAEAPRQQSRLAVMGLVGAGSVVDEGSWAQAKVPCHRQVVLSPVEDCSRGHREAWAPEEPHDRHLMEGQRWNLDHNWDW